ncbi:hypothetical protein BXY51_003885 [Actinoplanes cyaneus]|nr:hypothetical protein [Actinoplanes cyaneus]
MTGRSSAAGSARTSRPAAVPPVARRPDGRRAPGSMRPVGPAPGPALVRRFPVRPVLERPAPERPAPECLVAECLVLECLFLGRRRRPGGVGPTVVRRVCRAARGRFRPGGRSLPVSVVVRLPVGRGSPGRRRDRCHRARCRPGSVAGRCPPGSRSPVSCRRGRSLVGRGSCRRVSVVCRARLVRFLPVSVVFTGRCRPDRCLRLRCRRDVVGPVLRFRPTEAARWTSPGRAVLATPIRPCRGPVTRRRSPAPGCARSRPRSGRRRPVLRPAIGSARMSRRRGSTRSSPGRSRPPCTRPGRSRPRAADSRRMRCRRPSTRTTRCRRACTRPALFRAPTTTAVAARAAATGGPVLTRATVRTAPTEAGPPRGRLPRTRLPRVSPAAGRNRSRAALRRTPLRKARRTRGPVARPGCVAVRRDRPRGRTPSRRTGSGCRRTVRRVAGLLRARASRGPDGTRRSTDPAWPAFRGRAARHMGLRGRAFLGRAHPGRLRAGRRCPVPGGSGPATGGRSGRPRR